MPFSLPENAAFGLTQIKTYLDNELPDLVETNIFYLNHDFLDYFGEDLYQIVNYDFYDYYKFQKNRHLWIDTLRKSGMEVDYFGGMLGDWIFRMEAFGCCDDNADQYFRSIYPNREDLFQKVLSKRAGLKKKLDECMHSNQLLQYNVIAFTSRFQQQMAALALAKIIKEHDAEIITVLGGPNCESPAGAAIASQLKNIDYVFSGRRFLIGFKKFIEILHSGDKSNIETIKGVFTQNKNSLTDENNRNELSDEECIDTLLNLNYDSYFQSVSTKLKGRQTDPILFLETSRGCSWGEKTR